MSQETSVQPSLQDLMARFLSGQAQAHAGGLAAFDAAEVTPYEAGPVQPVDAAAAWGEALVAVAQGRTAIDAAKMSPPLHWPQLVAGHEPVVALAFCAGNFPQLVRNFHQILQTEDLTKLCPVSGRPTPAPQLAEWAQHIATKKQFPAALVALGALRLAKQFDEAGLVIAALASAVPAEWRGAWDNETAALAWHRGACTQARDLWRKQAPSLAVRFNLAMAELFLGNANAAQAALARVVGELPETTAWHHLARLYLTLAEMRG